MLWLKPITIWVLRKSISLLYLNDDLNSANGNSLMKISPIPTSLDFEIREGEIQKNEFY